MYFLSLHKSQRVVIVSMFFKDKKTDVPMGVTNLPKISHLETFLYKENS